ncbi:crotonase/enoyl-CoA hydratase family protein [Reyranella sp. CPCC 100927]|uniref:crotonase/enoyl-CoA hydratase family protein n=1 Tax=Reyranella sp. CPCC 100927 TaxID=2599616 RepID=UPI0011B68E55|nr:crotonase/enoyl-CoA hydratase family protein [Reyranella sp. CPCC 100927]TWS93901.1 crotonase/enoyl-CoA hydratase family protein [Reyranella sp. CPCC 100927]
MSAQGNEDAVKVSRQGHVVVITINRPEARNAVNMAVTTGIGDALEAADKDRDVRAIIITGAGDQAFCAGADLRALSRGERLGPTDGPRATRGFAGFVSFPIAKPIIAAVNGFALGGGTEIALASDLVVASETASFGLPEVKRGIMAAAGGAFRLLDQLPRKLAMEMVLTGEPITARRALELGLVNAVVPQDQVLHAALALAAKITANAPLAVQASKRVALGIVSGEIPSEQTAWELTRQEIRRLMESADAKEGPRAFAEKRTPVWRGE